MIKHHPKFELIQAYVNGDLPASLSVGISIHAEMCKECQQQIAMLTEQVAEASFELDTNDTNDDMMTFDTSDLDQVIESAEFNFENMIHNITDLDAIVDFAEVAEKSVTFKNKQFTLPTALSHIDLGKVANVGKLSRRRLQLDEDEIHTNILHIGAGGSVPEHQHKGFELTVLLDGTFSDESGTYKKGDFIMLDSSVKHNPISDDGCLCFTVSNAPLHFTQGINKLLNPIGNFIY